MAARIDQPRRLRTTCSTSSANTPRAAGTTRGVACGRAVLKEPRAETRRIESRAERREIREQALARTQGLARVD